MSIPDLFQMKEEKMLARIREAEKSQSLAELTQKISSLEFKVKTVMCLLAGMMSRPLCPETAHT